MDRTLDHGSAVTAVAVSHTADRVATASVDSVRVWNVADGATIRQFSPGLPAGGGFIFSPDDHFLLGAANKEGRVWNLEADGDTAVSVPSPQGIYDIDISADGRFAATAGRDKLVRVWELPTGKLRVPPLKHPGRVWEVAFRDDATEGDELFSLTAEDTTVRRWSLEDGTLVGEPQHLAPSAQWPVGFSPDGGTLSLTVPGNGTELWHWNGTAWSDPLLLRDEHFQKRMAIFGRDGTRLLLAGGNDITTWNLADGKPLGRPILNLESGTALSWADKLGLVVVLHENGGCRLWDTRTGRPVIAPYPESGATSVAIDPTGRVVVVGDSQGQAHLWPIPEPLDWPVEQLKRWAETMTGTELTPDGTFRPLDHEHWYQRLQQLHGPQDPVADLAVTRSRSARSQ